ncbi:MAG: DEAD/DEAH box helicase [Gemmatimonadales bacterium]
MPLSAFHPAVSGWFERRFASPTSAQARGWRAIRSGRSTLIAAPTGSGKTLAAFLNALDELLTDGVERGGQLPDETRVLYVSPLKALSADIHHNLAEPRREIRALAAELGYPEVKITAAVRSGDTPQSERQAMLRRPPHILVTTPESLFLLLTAARSREMLRTVRTVIVDEIHAVVESRRGSHLALSLERLAHVTGRPPLRIGLSATQRPIEDVARFLVGTGGVDGAGAPQCEIVDEGHLRSWDLGLEIPPVPLETVMSGEAWEDIYDRLADLAQEHRTTLVFVNTRRLAERMTRHLSERLGEENVSTHHGSLAREARLESEQRLKSGSLKLLVATASLELGIDIGEIDLVCQIGSPRRIAAFLQRVGRSGHTVGGTPKGRIFPLSRDDLVECAALLDAVRRGELDRIVIPEQPLDVLAQQVVAETAAEEWDEEDLLSLARRSWPYRDLSREAFGDIVRMVAHGFSTRRGRRGAYIHHDGVNGRIRGRKGARVAAITSGGAIPDNADYRVLLEPAGTYVGSLNEDFAIESMQGDIFQLGNTSWRILGIGSGVVRVEDARGEPPTIPFWFGEAPSRSDELSASISRLRARIDELLPPMDGNATPGPASKARTQSNGGPSHRGEREAEWEAAIGWLVDDVGLERSAAFQIVAYLAESRRLLGALPTADTLILERFFDESGGMQLVIHAPLGNRVNRAWGLALRKKFCRTFNFELQAAAGENALLLSLGPQHSFPLEDVFGYLKPETVGDVLVQAVLDSPLFQTRWRWNAGISLAVLRRWGGKRTPAQIQRMQAEDLLTAVFPDAAACLENIAGDREVPDHPLVRQTLEDCLQEAMDLATLRVVLERIRAGELRLIAKDTPEPSPLAHEILNARPYEFLDDAPLEERRARAVYTRRAFEPSSVDDLGALDADAIERVRAEARPTARDADELHDALITCGFLDPAECPGAWSTMFAELVGAGRATTAMTSNGSRPLWIAAERLPELRAALPDAGVEPAVALPAHLAADPPSREEATRELLRGRLEIAGPVTAARLAGQLGLSRADAEAALLALESEGAVLRGAFTPGTEAREWCDRRLLARIHRYTIGRLRSEIEPVAASDLMRFLFEWQKIELDHRVAGPEGVASVIDMLDGYEAPAGAWEPDILGSRCRDYEPGYLDALCLTGRVSWGRLSPPAGGFGSPRTPGPLRSSPMALFPRASAALWQSLAHRPRAEGLSAYAMQVVEALQQRGASFFTELVTETELLPTQVEVALGELAARGLVSSDGFAGLRALLTPSGKRRPLGEPGRKTPRRRKPSPAYSVEEAGRWSLLRPDAWREGDDAARDSRGERGRVEPARFGAPDASTETVARVLLRRYGVVFRRLLERETNLPPWRDLLLVYRRLEARGEVRGGRFVSGFAGEQFALPEAVGSLRAARRAEPTGELLAVSAADPLNLAGIITPGERIPAVPSNRVVYRDGLPVAAREGGEVRRLGGDESPPDPELRQAFVRPLSPALKRYLGKAG